MCIVLAEAKAALEKGGLQEYNRVASHAYNKLSAEEKDELHRRRIAEPVRRMSTKEVRAEGKAIFKKIRKLVRHFINGCTRVIDLFQTPNSSLIMGLPIAY